MRSLLTVLTLLMLLSACQKKAELTNLDLSSMAAIPETVTIVIKNYKPQNGNSYQNLFVSNFSVTAHHGQLEWSSARDGLSDDLKTETFNIYGFTSDDSESAVTGFADFILYGAGINLTNYAQLACSATKMGSSSNDMIIYNDARYAGSPQRVLGLRDCQKSYLGLNPNNFDNNHNSIPDYLELRCGMNPLNPNEAYVSGSGDGVSNIEKCKMHLPLDEDANSQPAQLLGYRYAQTTNADASKNFTISNIPILKHGEDNMLVFYFTEIDDSTGVTSLYTAYALLKNGYNGRTLEFDYWATTPANYYNQQVVVPDVTTP